MNNWINDAYGEVQTFTNEDIFTDESIAFAQVNVSDSVSEQSFPTGFAALTIGAAAVAFAIYAKRQNKTFNAASDEDYLQI